MRWWSTQADARPLQGPTVDEDGRRTIGDEDGRWPLRRARGDHRREIRLPVHIRGRGASGGHGLMKRTLDSARPGSPRVNTDGDALEGTISEEDRRRRTPEAEEQATDTGKV